MAAVLAWSAGCASARPRAALPSGAGAPATDAASWLDEATAGCADVTSFTAEMALRGRIASRRVRGRVLAGTEASGRVRLEGVAPFGAPLFVLASNGHAATLVLPREGRVVTGHAFEDVLDALAGVRLGGADLHAALTGCGLASRAPTRGRAFGDGWRAVDVESGATIWLSRVAGIQPHLVAVVVPRLSIEYGAGRPGGHVDTVRLVTPAPAARERAVDLELTLSQVERNGPIDAGAFDLHVPAGATPMTLDELRRSGLLGR